MHGVDAFWVIACVCEYVCLYVCGCLLVVAQQPKFVQAICRLREGGGLSQSGPVMGVNYQQSVTWHWGALDHASRAPQCHVTTCQKVTAFDRGRKCHIHLVHSCSQIPASDRLLTFIGGIWNEVERTRSFIEQRSNLPELRRAET